MQIKNLFLTNFTKNKSILAFEFHYFFFLILNRCCSVGRASNYRSEGPRGRLIADIRTPCTLMVHVKSVVAAMSYMFTVESILLVVSWKCYGLITRNIIMLKMIGNAAFD